ncbi:MAG: hypothetical protein WCC28_12605 [Mycobacterium sp.]|uniref:hypothetical protein n=1 Tax=Mycobacterium sp. TaxID=1785 RepID=UPI003C75274F
MATSAIGQRPWDRRLGALWTAAELQHLFDVVDDFVDEQHRNGSKRWMTALRDSTAFKIGYAYGSARVPVISAVTCSDRPIVKGASTFT